MVLIVYEFHVCLKSHRSAQYLPSVKSYTPSCNLLPVSFYTVDHFYMFLQIN